MKLSFLSKNLLTAFLAIVAIVTMNAQSGTTPAASKTVPTQAAKPMPSGTDEYKELNLTPEQQSKFQQIDQDYAGKKKAAREAGNNAEMKKAREERVAARKAVLNAEQVKKYDEIVAKNEAKRAEQSQKRQEIEAAKAASKGQQAEEKAENKSEKATEKAAKKSDKADQKVEKSSNKVVPKEVKAAKAAAAVGGGK